MPVNAHKLFFSNNHDNPSFHHKLKVADAIASRLRAARDDIRATIVGALANWRGRLTTSEMFVDGVDRTIARPRFRMQGSFAYHTEVLPYHLPPQQIDMDDGMFLPIRLIFADGQFRPDVASKALFRLIDTVVAELCRQKGWKHIDTKPSCVRVEISRDEHVDLALYAAPDTEFLRVDDALRKQASKAESSYVFDELMYMQIDGSQILLANRDSGWVPSNPKLLEDWYTAKIATHGPHLRRVSRYLKAWRDFNLNCTGLTSIALMAIAVSAFDANPGEIDEGRDDKTLLKVAETLAVRLGSEIRNPVVPGQRLDQNWSDEERSAYCAAGANLHAALIEALIDESSIEKSLEILIDVLSDRIPNNLELLEPELSDLEIKSLPLPAISMLGSELIDSRATAAESAVIPSQQTRPYCEP